MCLVEKIKIKNKFVFLLKIKRIERIKEHIFYDHLLYPKIITKTT